MRVTPDGSSMYTGKSREAGEKSRTKSMLLESRLWILATVCLGSTNNLTLCWLFGLKKWRVGAILHSSVINNAMIYDTGPPLFYFFIFFKVKLPPQSAEKCVCMVKTRAKILAELF